MDYQDGLWCGGRYIEHALCELPAAVLLSPSLCTVAQDTVERSLTNVFHQSCVQCCPVYSVLGKQKREDPQPILHICMREIAQPVLSVYSPLYSILQPVQCCPVVTVKSSVYGIVLCIRYSLVCSAAHRSPPIASSLPAVPSWISPFCFDTHFLPCKKF